MSRTNLFILAMISALFAVLAFAASRVIKTTMESEYNLSAVIFTCEVIYKYIDDQKRWPSSWDDMDNVKVEQFGRLAWPDSKEELRNRVVVDFGLTPDDVTRILADQSEPVHPIGPAYPSYRGKVRGLMEHYGRMIEAGKVPGAQNPRPSSAAPPPMP